MLNAVKLRSEGVNEFSLNFKETELCLGLPGGGSESETPKSSGKRGFSETIGLKLTLPTDEKNLTEKTKNLTKEEKLLPNTIDPAKPPARKAQAVGWPPVRSYRRNVMTIQKSKTDEEDKVSSNANTNFVKVSLDGAPYLRKVDLKMYSSYWELSDALSKMFSSFTIGNCQSEGMKDFMNESKLMDQLKGSEYMPTYEDKDGDWMLVGDVPWGMFVDSCKRLRIMKGSEAIGLAPRAAEKLKNQNRI